MMGGKTLDRYVIQKQLVYNEQFQEQFNKKDKFSYFNQNMTDTLSQSLQSSQSDQIQDFDGKKNQFIFQSDYISEDIPNRNLNQNNILQNLNSLQDLLENMKNMSWFPQNFQELDELTCFNNYDKYAVKLILFYIDVKPNLIILIEEFKQNKGKVYNMLKNQVQENDNKCEMIFKIKTNLDEFQKQLNGNQQKQQIYKLEEEQQIYDFFMNLSKSFEQNSFFSQDEQLIVQDQQQDSQNLKKDPKKKSINLVQDRENIVFNNQENQKSVFFAFYQKNDNFQIQFTDEPYLDQNKKFKLYLKQLKQNDIQMPNEPKTNGFNSRKTIYSPHFNQKQLSQNQKLKKSLVSIQNSKPYGQQEKQFLKKPIKQKLDNQLPNIILESDKINLNNKQNNETKNPNIQQNYNIQQSSILNQEPIFLYDAKNNRFFQIKNNEPKQENQNILKISNIHQSNSNFKDNDINNKINNISNTNNINNIYNNNIIKNINNNNINNFNNINNINNINNLNNYNNNLQDSKTQFKPKSEQQVYLPQNQLSSIGISEIPKNHTNSMVSFITGGQISQNQNIIGSYPSKQLEELLNYQDDEDDIINNNYYNNYESNSYSYNLNNVYDKHANLEQHSANQYNKDDLKLVSPIAKKYIQKLKNQD
ncbi:hypothetical protein PPERSA_13026 [Pseudocohnilembus persalinus]|uniref:Uncharacterized protein n=1 Tax=Pseudocohnilembus persalinus TaxID=266149 RepID=A0A0V0R240_PSEPJ|nr:hypothetical protein PPERSA_13026 [Pseudocohnilembus persalinus]|eukprot:KRX08545.1 hypothetical protein PPERSA_13026 [Pseudocohnilembus persalinus]